MAMFNFNYKTLSQLNSFNELGKDRYLSYMNKPFKEVSDNESSLTPTIVKDEEIKKSSCTIKYICI